jgi:hypothetical protein
VGRSRYGRRALTVADDADPLLTVGYLQGSAPAAVTASAPVLAWKGAAVSEPIVDVGDELVVATGKAAHPRVIRAARMGAPTADRVRLRAVNAVVGAEVTASLHRVASGPGPLPATGASVWPLGALALGAHGPALDLSATGRLELWATASDRSLVAPLPDLEAGHAHDLIVGTSAAGERIALVVRDDGLTSVVAGPSYVTRLRVANLTGKALAVARDATGRLRVGSQSPADVPIDWREARDDLTTVRVMNLTGQSGLTFTVQPWHSAPPVTDVIAQDGGTYAYQLRAGAQTVTLTNAATAKSWTWSGEPAGDTAHTIAFWKSPAGPVASLSLSGAHSAWIWGELVP